MRNGEPMKVIHVVRALETGGLESLVLQSCARMRSAHGLDASVYALLPGDGLAQRPEHRDVPCVTVSRNGCQTIVGAAVRLARLFRRERPHVVHVHNFFSHVRAAAAAKWARVPVLVHTKHGAQYPTVWGSRRLAGAAYRLSDVLVAISEDVRQGLMRTYRFAPGKVRLVVNGIDTERFGSVSKELVPGGRRVLGIEGRPLIGTVCRLSPEKGVPTLLEAFARLAPSMPDARLLIVGDGAERAACQTRAQELGVGDRTHFLGMRDDVAAIYPLLDIYVQPSYTEGISLTILEACACGLPVIATAVGGNPEIVAEGRSGRLVPPGNAQALANAIQDTWADNGAAFAMGQAARRRVVESFSLERMVSDYVDLYWQVYSGKAGIVAPRHGKPSWLRKEG